MEEALKISIMAHRWTRGFNCIPQAVLVKLVNAGDELVEITPGRNEEDSFLPMWGTMWSFCDMSDRWWIKDEKNLQAMADCGFRIYQHEDYDYIFGIDGMGYSYHDKHFIPLYKARGLRWHLQKDSNPPPARLLRDWNRKVEANVKTNTVKIKS